MAISVTEKEYGWRQDGNEQALSVTYWVLGATGTLDAQRTAVMAATGIPAIGATRIASTVKCWSRTAEHLDEDVWQVVAEYRTEKVDDLIMNAASGTVVDKGMDIEIERTTRYEDPSGSLYQLGVASILWPNAVPLQEPHLVAYWDRVHDSYSGLKTAATAIAGAVNSATWNGGQPGRWLCLGVNAYSVRRDSALRYVARYTFSYARRGWNVRKAGAFFDSYALGATTYVVATGSLVLYPSATFPAAFTF